MTAVTQLTGGAFKYTSPSNYSTGKDGAEATVHFVVADGASVEDAVSIANLARSEAIRLVTGQPAPFASASAPAPTAPAVATPTAVVTEAMPPATTLTAGSAGIVEAGSGPTALIGASHSKPTGDTIIGAETAASPLLGGGSPATTTSSAPTSVLGQTAAQDAVTSALGASITSPSPASAPAEITDEDMKHAVENKIKELAASAPSQEVAALGPVRIQKLLGEFIPLGPGVKVYALNQAQRAAYLERLKTLTLQ